MDLPVASSFGREGADLSKKGADILRPEPENQGGKGVVIKTHLNAALDLHKCSAKDARMQRYIYSHWRAPQGDQATVLLWPKRTPWSDHISSNDFTQRRHHDFQ
jgi:hypothetical protein